MSNRIFTPPESDRDALSDEAVAIGMGWMLCDNRMRRFVKAIMDDQIARHSSTTLAALYENANYADQKQAEATLGRHRST